MQSNEAIFPIPSTLNTAPQIKTYFTVLLVDRWLNGYI